MSITVNGTTGLNFPDGTSQPTAGFVPFRNKFINGDMRIAQRGTSATNVANDTPTCVDRWSVRYGYTGGTTDCEQGTSGPSGLPYTFKVTHKTATAATTAQWYCARQKIEKINTIDLMNTTSFSVSFWYKSNRTGNHAFNWDVSNTFSGTGVNGGTTFSVTSANTWEYKTVTVNYTPGTISGADVTAQGLILNIGFSVSGVTTFTSISVNDYFELTGVQLERGAASTAFEHRPFGTELALCHRYCYTGRGGDVTKGMALSVNNSYIWVPVATGTPMRARPTVTLIELRTRYMSTDDGAPEGVVRTASGADHGYYLSTNATNRIVTDLFCFVSGVTFPNIGYIWANYILSAEL
jgi:hypothetical protein